MSFKIGTVVKWVVNDRRKSDWRCSPVCYKNKLMIVTNRSGSDYRLKTIDGDVLNDSWYNQLRLEKATITDIVKFKLCQLDNRL